MFGQMFRILTSGAEHIRAQAEIDAKRLTQKARNENQAAQSGLANFSRALSNKRQMDAAGSSINAITENIGRNLDAAATGNLARRIQTSEELGAMSAVAAAAGVGGSTIEQFNQQVHFTEAIQQEQIDRAIKSDLYLTASEKANVLTNATAGQDLSQSFANLDFTQYVDHQKMGGMQKLLTLAGAGVATYFGGPQAGAAVMDTSLGLYETSNGNFAAAANSFNNAFTGALAGAKTYTSLGGEGQSGEAWGKGFFKNTSNLLGSIRLS